MWDNKFSVTTVNTHQLQYNSHYLHISSMKKIYFPIYSSPTYEIMYLYMECMHTYLNTYVYARDIKKKKDMVRGSRSHEIIEAFL